jgi:hypothetical protein
MMSMIVQASLQSADERKWLKADSSGFCKIAQITVRAFHGAACATPAFHHLQKETITMKCLSSRFRLGHWLGRASTLLAFVTLTSLFGTAAHAVPSYTRQTGSECAACHVGGYGPQLTPYGIKFKIGGYTDTDGQGGKAPLSAMLVANWTRTSKDAGPEDVADHFKSNNNTALQEASLFLAGRLTDNIGTFTQVTYSGVDRKSALDQVDLRYARGLQLAGKDATVGLSFNSNPTLTDPFNTLGQWRFPYTSSDFNVGFGPSPLFENLAGTVFGANAYTLIDNNLYAEFGLYDTVSKNTLKQFNADDPGKFKGLASYWRVAYFKDMKRDNFSVGLFGFNADLQPDRANLGNTDKYRDIGLDAAYQYLGNREHIYALNASYVREWQKLGYTFEQSGSDNLKNHIDQFRIAASYHYNQTWGLTAGLFATRGNTDTTFYGDSLNGKPNTSGYILQADWTPWGKEGSWGAPFANVRLGVQYTGYKRYMGGSSYLVGDGNDGTISRAAKDNNTLMLFLWSAI